MSAAYGTPTRGWLFRRYSGRYDDSGEWYIGFGGAQRAIKSLSGCVMLGDTSQGW